MLALTQEMHCLPFVLDSFYEEQKYLPMKAYTTQWYTEHNLRIVTWRQSDIYKLSRINTREKTAMQFINIQMFHKKKLQVLRKFENMNPTSQNESPYIPLLNIVSSYCHFQRGDAESTSNHQRSGVGEQCRIEKGGATPHPAQFLSNPGRQQCS